MTNFPINSHGNREHSVENGTLVLTDREVIAWFHSLEATPTKQDEWIQDVVGEGTAFIDGYMYSPDEPKLEIDYKYLAWDNDE